MRFKVPSKAGVCTAHAQKVIDKHIAAAGDNRTVKCCRASHARPAVSAGVGHHVGLQDAAIDRPAQSASQDIGEDLGDGVDAVVFIGVGADQGWRRSATRLHLSCHGERLFVVEGRCRGIRIARLRCAVAWMLLVGRRGLPALLTPVLGCALRWRQCQAAGTGCQRADGRFSWKSALRAYKGLRRVRQNKKYFCAIGSSVAGSQVSNTPSARTW